MGCISGQGVQATVYEIGRGREYLVVLVDILDGWSRFGREFSYSMALRLFMGFLNIWIS